jgi:hypothetical protein
MRVLGLQASHLLLIRTNLGCGTVLTAACARQDCSASGLVWFGSVWFLTHTDKRLLLTCVDSFVTFWALAVCGLIEAYRRFRDASCPKHQVL